jgi:DegV family protein with EDD domain
LQILTDTGADFNISRAEQERLKIQVIPQIITVDGKSYRSGIDIQLDELYQLFETSQTFPVTSLPSTGDFVSLYRQMAREDREILSIHVSSGLSGTFNAATVAAHMVPEAHVTVVDSRSVSIVQGWQVTAAARAVQAGEPMKRTLELIAKIEAGTNILFTLKDLAYLIHGGRVSHIRGLLASALQIKPLLAVEKTGGRLVQMGLARTFSHALTELAQMVTRMYPRGSALAVIAGHTRVPEGVMKLREHMDALFHCHWREDIRISPVLGAHGGPTLVGMAFGLQEVFNDLAID